MICIDDCSTCKHERPLKDGWRFVCDAFPYGAPTNFAFGKVKQMKHCNNGIGYEPKENKTKIYTARNKDGFLCSYDKDTHKCVGVMLSTGDNVEMYKEKHGEYIGQIDPKFENDF